MVLEDDPVAGPALKEGGEGSVSTWRTGLPTKMKLGSAWPDLVGCGGESVPGTNSHNVVQIYSHS